jgi:hypothetical protein
MKILLGDFNNKAGREDNFRPTIGNDSLHEIINDTGVRVLNVATSKNLTAKSTCSHTATFINSLGRLLMERFKLTIF